MGGAALNTGLHTWREDGRSNTKHGTTYLEGRWEEQHKTRDYIPGGKMGGALNTGTTYLEGRTYLPIEPIE